MFRNGTELLWTGNEYGKCLPTTRPRSSESRKTNGRSSTQSSATMATTHEHGAKSSAARFTATEPSRGAPKPRAIIDWGRDDGWTSSTK